MKTKRLTLNHFIFLFICATAILFFTGCENDETLNEANTIEFSQKNGDDPKVTATIGMRLHRGQKWSEKHNVKTCTQGFGICSVKLEKVSVEYKNVKLDFKLTENKSLANSSARITFMEDVKAKEGDIFISSEDGDITFPGDVLEKLKLQQVIILADDYVTHFDAEHPYGYVDVDCIVK